MSFGSKNFYYNSLGNSVVFNGETANHLRNFIQKRGIREIFFVLSITNPIITDALGNQEFSDIRGLSDFYGEVLKQKGHSQVLYRESNRQFTIISHHLNKKVRELQLALNVGADRVKIGGKIYNAKDNAFYKIYADLVCTENFSLN
ncbi:MAG: hypothetical protein AAF969_09515 [Bacteroidota bacterium]